MLRRIKKLFTRKPKTTLKAIVYLKNGAELETSVSVERGFSTDDMTASTIWRFVSRDRKQAYFLAGDRISYIQVTQ